MKLKYIFGPVLSRRLGNSLGIDLVPYKTCSLDCIYCECGKTNNLTARREEYVPTKDVINELNRYLINKPEIDYITFSGSGEPLLHNGIKRIINYLKDNYDYKIALLTNGIHFIDRNVIEEVERVDLIIPSLDGVTQETFIKINRPLKNIFIDDVIDSLIKLRSNFSNQIWLEIFIIPGINDNNDELVKFKEVIKKIKPDRVQLNSLDRIGTLKNIKKASEKELQSIAELFEGKIDIIT
ncbi:radical SAM protein [Iocasia frigidifontis]|uniref:Radical SAM protein n=1 Tax=Iocasia fonsfrigidae TaxID=2682810 RepID=A0A8A7KF16_9FIRM|nr:radical SAM protein [Iocasia fonsfrigidae]QTL98278.1 radical SAM protein [Iocasia fonsfrigidae]